MESIVTKYKDMCFFCGGKVDCEHHLCFGRGIRDLADQDGIKVPICHRCHTLGRNTEKIHENPMAEKLSKMLGQAIWEKNYGDREAFRKL